jgi:hypothetical protein
MSTITQMISALSTPPSRTDPANFDDRADQFLGELPDRMTEANAQAEQMNTVAGEVNDHRSAAESASAAAVAAAAISAWEAGTPYAVGDTKYGSDGHSYRAIQSSTGVDPVTDGGLYWTCLTKPYAGEFKNKIINGRKTINQRVFGGNWSAMAVGDYGYDRWRKYDADSMEQVIEAGNLDSGLYTISWTGGGTGSVGGVAVASGDTVDITVTGNLSVIVPFDATSIQLEPGAVVTAYELRPVSRELGLCQWYYEKTYNPDDAPGTVTAEGAIRVEERNVSMTMHQSRLAFLAPKRVVPALTFYSPETGNAGFVDDTWGNRDIAVESYAASTGGLHLVTLLEAATFTASEACWVNFHFTADAEIH